MKRPAEEFGGSLTLGREGPSGLPHHQNRPEVGLARARRNIHHILWQYLTLSEMFALLALSACAPLSQQALAEQLHLEKSTVSRLAGHLEQRRWVKRVRDQHDTRMFRLQLSETGHEHALRLVRSLAERHERLLAALKPDEQEALAYGLSALIRALHSI